MSQYTVIFLSCIVLYFKVGTIKRVLLFDFTWANLLFNKIVCVHVCMCVYKICMYACIYVVDLQPDLPKVRGSFSFSVFKMKA